MDDKLNFEKIIHAALYTDPQLPTTKLYEHATTQVVQVHTPTPLIVRIAAGDTASYAFQAGLLNELAGENALTSQILHWETREIENQPYGIQIQTYIPGQPIEHYPDHKDAKAIVLAAPPTAHPTVRGIRQT